MLVFSSPSHQRHADFVRLHVRTFLFQNLQAGFRSFVEQVITSVAGQEFQNRAHGFISRGWEAFAVRLLFCWHRASLITIRDKYGPKRFSNQSHRPHLLFHIKFLTIIWRQLYNCSQL